MREFLEKIFSGQRLNVTENQSIFEQMLAGKMPDAQIAAFLIYWRLNGETTAELTSGAQALRHHAAKINLPATARPSIDNCGTGGDGSNSFNISTAAAVVAAAAGAKVTKHGNRSVSSKCGSADLLFAAGFPETLTTDAACKLLTETGMTFFFAPNCHPVMRFVGEVRKTLGVRTIFNLLGPLANPIAPDYQLLGVGDAKYLKPMAETLAALNVKKAIVVHSHDGLDELSPAAPSQLELVEGGKLSSLVVDPKKFGIKANLKDLTGGDPSVNLGLLMQILAETGPGAKSGLTQAVCLNAGAVLWLYGLSSSLGEGIEKATDQVSSGRAQKFFDQFIDTAQKLSKTWESE